MNLYDFHRFAASPPPADPDCANINPRALTAEQRAHIVDWLEWQFIATSHTTAADVRLTALVDSNRGGRPGAKRIAILTGVNGVGKSTFALEWARAMYRRELADQAPLLTPGTIPSFDPEPGVHAVWTPVVWLNVDAGMGKPELDAAICSFFGLSADGTRIQKYERARHALFQHRTRIVVVDDAHFLRTREKLGRQLLDHLKSLNTELGDHGATMVLVGADLNGSPIQIDPQVACRSVTVDLPSTDAVPVSSDARAETQRSLAAIEHRLRASVPGIGERQLTNHLAPRIAERVGGRHGDLIRLVCDATELFITDPTASVLTIDHINAVEISDRASQLEVTRRRNQRVRRTPNAASSRR